MGDFITGMVNFISSGSIYGEKSNSKGKSDDKSKDRSYDEDPGYDYRDAHGVDPPDDDDD